MAARRAQVWSGTAWEDIGGPPGPAGPQGPAPDTSAFVLKAGDTMTGALVTENAYLGLSRPGLGALRLVNQPGAEENLRVEAFDGSLRWVFASGGDFSQEMKVGSGRSNVAAGGITLPGDGLNADLVMAGRSAPITGNWAGLRIHPSAGVAGMCVVGDTNQSGDMYLGWNADNGLMFRVSPAGNGYFAGGVSVATDAQVNWMDGNIGIRRTDSRLQIDGWGGSILRNSSNGTYSHHYGSGFTLVSGAHSWEVYNAGNSALEFAKPGGGADGNIGMSCGTGTLYVNGMSVMLNSDARMKTDVEDLEPALDKVLAIRPVSFKWLPEYDNPYNPDRVHLGVIAQELAEVVPEAVTAPAAMQNDEGGISPMQVAYPALIPVLVKAMQELTERVAALEARVVELGG